MERFLIVTGDFVDTGGMDVANFSFARHLAETGVDVHLVAHRVAPELAKHPHITVHRVPRPIRSHLLGSPLLDGVGRLRAALGRPQHVVVNGGNCGAGTVNWVHYLHSAFEQSGDRVLRVRVKQQLIRPWLLHTERTAIEKARVVIANSNRTREDILNHLNVAPERVHTVYYGVNGALFRPASDEQRARARDELGWSKRPVVTFIGALGDRRKGFDTLFEAWEQLCRGDWDADLVVVGEGAELPAWKERAEVRGLADRIRFLGFRRDVSKVLSASDAVVAPTRYEAYGLGVHEGLCCGLPAIVSRSAGVSERVRGDLEQLLLSDPNDASELCTRLRRWRENRSRYDAEARSLSDVLRARSWDDMAKEMLSLLH